MRFLCSLLTSLLRILPDPDRASTPKSAVMPYPATRSDRPSLVPLASSEAAVSPVSSAVPTECGVCGARASYFDRWLDINLCVKCGAHETAVGWQAPGATSTRLQKRSA
jgi:hypothetical protein